MSYINVCPILVCRDVCVLYQCVEECACPISVCILYQCVEKCVCPVSVCRGVCASYISVCVCPISVCRGSVCVLYQCVDVCLCSCVQVVVSEGCVTSGSQQEGEKHLEKVSTPARFTPHHLLLAV